jgi:hypothetical protein
MEVEGRWKQQPSFSKQYSITPLLQYSETPYSNCPRLDNNSTNSTTSPRTLSGFTTYILYQMKIYLDNCCFNRPFDDQSQIRIRLETEAKLFIQGKILEGRLDLIWSYIIDYENLFNPFEDRKKSVSAWKHRAVLDISETPKVIDIAKRVQQYGVKSKDALHLACAIDASCDYFLTTDDDLEKNLVVIDKIQIMNPISFIKVLENPQ